METLEIEKINNILPQINQNGYVDLSKYDRIPALDIAIASGLEPEVCNSWEEYIALMKKWDEEEEDD